jgi:hypothetical protein
VYLVLDDFGALGCAYRETDAAQADPRRVVADLLSGQYRHPLRVVAFNTAEGWARDVSADIARKVLNCALELDQDLPGARFCGAGVWVRARPTPTSKVRPVPPPILARSSVPRAPWDLGPNERTPQ